jgi:hypothetical protein
MFVVLYQRCAAAHIVVSTYEMRVVFVRLRAPMFGEILNRSALLERIMEHRWGRRARVDMGITLHPGFGAVARGRLTNVSLSGALVRTEMRLPTFTRVVVELPSQDSNPESGDGAAAMLGAYVVRDAPDGFGLEWTEFSPPAIAALLYRAAAGRSSRTPGRSRRRSEGKSV